MSGFSINVHVSKGQENFVFSSDKLHLQRQNLFVLLIQFFDIYNFFLNSYPAFSSIFSDYYLPIEFAEQNNSAIIGCNCSIIASFDCLGTSHSWYKNRTPSGRFISAGSIYPSERWQKYRVIWKFSF